MPGGSLSGGEMDSVVYETKVLKGSAVSLTGTNSWNDILSVDVEAGVWLFHSHATFMQNSSVIVYTRVSDGATSGCPVGERISDISELAASCIINVTSPTTFKLQAARSATVTVTAETNVLSIAGATAIQAIKLSGY